MSEKLAKHVGSVSFATLLSRILGYIRDAMVAHAFGGGAMTDAFYAAFRLSNLFRRMLGEGPLSTAFVPVFSEHLARREGEEARTFFQTLTTTLAVVLAGVTALTFFGAPWIVEIAARGFKAADPEKFRLTVDLTRHLSPFVFFVCLAAVGAAALNALGHFFVPALAPAMLSVATIAYVLFHHFWPGGGMRGLAVSTTLGAVLHFAVLLPFLSREKLGLRWRWDPFHPDVRRVTLLVIPAVWGLSIDQINAYVDTICASFLSEGAVTAMYNSNRLMQFALALFGTAVSTATLPHMAACAARQDMKGLKENLNFSMRLTLFAVLPAMTGLVVLSVPIVQTLFEHGRFTHANTLMTASALAAYSLGLPAYSLVKILVTGFYSLKDTKTPVKIATLCLFVNLGGILLLMGRWGVGGLAFATAFSSFMNAVLLILALRRRLGLMDGRRILDTCIRASAASAFMGIAAWGVCACLPGPLIFRTLAGVAAGTAAYVLLARALDMEELDHVLSILRRKRPPAAA